MANAEQEMRDLGCLNGNYISTLKVTSSVDFRNMGKSLSNIVKVECKKQEVHHRQQFRTSSD